MKEFIKWLGVNEQVAKAAVWLLIIMIFLIIINTALSSLGFPNYMITYDNLKNINIGEPVNLLSRLIVCVLNFYATMLIIFRIKEAGKLLKWSMVYLILNTVVYAIGGYIPLQIFIFIFFVLFPYLYTKKDKKYLLYGLGAIIVNTIVEAVAYYFKASLIDITTISRLTRSLLSIDYFIIMAIIILVKEIYIRERGEKNGKLAMVGKIQQRK